jgi:hypothetical protein
VLTGLQTFLNNAEQAEKHRVSWVSYYRLQQSLNLFLLRYAEANASATKREEALKELEDISKEIEALCESSITLTSRAYAEAEDELRKETVPNREAHPGTKKEKYSIRIFRPVRVLFQKFFASSAKN